MKYENSKQVVDIVSEIERHQQRISELTNYPIIDILKQNGDRICKVGVYGNSEHSFTPFANQFIEMCKSDLLCKINELKYKLEKL